MAMPLRLAQSLHLRGWIGSAGARSSGGYPGIPLEKYTGRRPPPRIFYEEALPRRGCTVSCVQQIAVVDNWRGPQTLEAGRRAAFSTESLVQLTRAAQEGRDW